MARVDAVDVRDRKRDRILILGAAGRDFHNFNVCYRDDPRCEVIGFTATQIPRIDGRIYPAQLSGPLYPLGLPIWPEDELEELVAFHHVERCVLSYSDLSYQAAMSLASRAIAAGSDFELLGWRKTAIPSKKPVIAICAVRTGSGKSQASRYVVDRLWKAGLRVVVVRHPMPYGDIGKQAVQRFSCLFDLDEANVTFEEREEYETHLRRGTVVYAGVDYERILRKAEEESDVIIWDGGNNDLPFFRPDLWITVADALRPGQELASYPGEANFRAAHVILINKANSASAESIEAVKDNAARTNPKAEVILAASEVTVEDPGIIKGKRVLVIEDGPTITHGGMSHGAGFVAAQRYGASEIIDPGPFAVGSIKAALEKYRHIGKVLPAMGYYPEQVQDLEKSINQAECDSVVIGTPIDMRRLIEIQKPATLVHYELADMGEPTLGQVVERFVANLG